MYRRALASVENPFLEETPFATRSMSKRSEQTDVTLSTIVQFRIPIRVPRGFSGNDRSKDGDHATIEKTQTDVEEKVVEGNFEPGITGGSENCLMFFVVNKQT